MPAEDESGIFDRCCLYVCVTGISKVFTTKQFIRPSSPGASVKAGQEQRAYILPAGADVLIQPRRDGL